MTRADEPIRSSWAVSLVLYHSSPDVLRLVLGALEALARQPVEVRIHVNDDGDDFAARLATDPTLSAWLASVLRVTASAANLGFSGAHNANLAASFAAGSDAVLVLNPDVILEPSTVARLAEAADGKALAGPLLTLADPVTLAPEHRIDSAGIRWTWTGRHLDDHQGEPFVGTDAAPYPVEGITGACLWVPRLVHDLIVSQTGEFFDEDFIAYREDAELGLRASRLGVRQIVVPTATALHVRALRGGARGVPALDRLGVQNRFLIAFKHGRHRPGAWFGAPLRDVVVVAGVVLRERHSMPGLRRAWELRPKMRAKGRRITAAQRRAVSARPGDQ